MNSRWYDEFEGKPFRPDADDPKLAAALKLAEEGFAIFPAPVGTKASYKKAEYSKGARWGMTRDPDEIRRDWTTWPDANIGLPTGEENGVLGLDLDCKNDKDGVAWLKEMEAIHGPMPKTVSARSPSGGLHFYFSTPDFEVKNSQSGIAPGVDIRGEGGMMLVAPSEKPDVGEYAWINSPHDTSVADAPEWLLDRLRDHEARRSARTHAQRRADWPPITSKGITRQLEKAARKVALAGDGERNATLNAQAFWLGQAAGAGWMDATETREALEGAAIEAGLDPDEIGKTIGSGFAAGEEKPRPATVPPEFDHSDDALARQLGDEWGWNDDAKYVAKLKSWLFWNGTKYAEAKKLDEMTQVRLFIAERVREVVQYAEDIAPHLPIDAEREKMRKWAKLLRAALQDARKIAAVERLARSNAASAAAHDDFDADPSLLGTPGGVVDLRTGKLRPATQADMISKTTAVAPARVKPERWLKFLDEVFDDQEIIAFVKRLAGYMLTGETREHKLPFAYGGGRNGKGVLLQTLQNIMGDYGWTINHTVLMQSKHPQHSTDVLALRGRRLAVAHELQEGAVLNEALVKTLTGGDDISARGMNQDPIVFKINAKIVMSGNNKPAIRGGDRAMRDRLLLLPFNVTFTDDPKEVGKPGVKEPDRLLKEKLQAEYPAILQWMIEGAEEWYRDGLKPPAAVKLASDEYMDDQDHVMQWIEEECEVVPDAFLPNDEILPSFNTWYEAKGFRVGKTQTWLTQQLVRKGYQAKKNRIGYQTVRGIVGLRLREDI